MRDQDNTQTHSFTTQSKRDQWLEYYRPSHAVVLVELEEVEIKGLVNPDASIKEGCALLVILMTADDVQDEDEDEEGHQLLDFCTITSFQVMLVTKVGDLLLGFPISVQIA